MPSYSNVGSIVPSPQPIELRDLSTAGHQIFIRFATGGLFGAGFDGVYTVTIGHRPRISPSPSHRHPCPAHHQRLTALIPMVSGGYSVINSNNVSTILLQHTGNHNLVAGEQVWIKFLTTNRRHSRRQRPLHDRRRQRPQFLPRHHHARHFHRLAGHQRHGRLSAQARASQWTRNGTVNLGFSTWNLGKTDNSSTRRLSIPPQFSISSTPTIASPARSPKRA